MAFPVCGKINVMTFIKGFILREFVYEAVVYSVVCLFNIYNMLEM